MIIWRGLGFLVFVIMVLLVFLFGWILEMMVNRSLPEDTSLIIGLVVAGIIVWFLGKKLNGGSEKVLADQETGTAYKMGTRHSLFFHSYAILGTYLYSNRSSSHREIVHMMRHQTAQ